MVDTPETSAVPAAENTATPAPASTETKTPAQDNTASVTAEAEVSLLEEGKIEYDKAFLDDKGNVKVDDVYKAFTEQKARADGLRKKLSRGLEVAPDSEDGYKIDVKEDYKTYIPDNDPVVAILKKVGVKHDINNSQLNGIINEVAEALIASGNVAKPVDPAELEAQNKASIEAYKAEEMKKLGADSQKIVETIKTTLGGLKNSGYLSAEEYSAAINMGYDATAVKVLEKLCLKAGEGTVPTSLATNNTGMTKESVLARYAEKDEQGNLKIDNPQFLQETRKMMEDLSKKGLL